MLITTFDKIALSQKHNIAIYGDCGEYTYSELFDMSVKYSLILQKLGFDKCMTLAVESPSNGEFVAIYLACARLGICIIPIDTRLTTDEVSRILGDSMPAGVIIFDDNGNLSNVSNNESYSESRISLDNFITLKIHKYMKKNQYVKEGDLVVQYSSGSTGKPKGVVLTQNNIYYKIMNWNKTISASSKDIYLNTLTLGHCFGLYVHTLSAIFAKAKVYMMDINSVLPNRICNVIKSEKITIFGALPYMYQMFNRMSEDNVDFRSIRYLISGSAPLGENTWKTFEKKFKRGINQVYGLTEVGLIMFNTKNLDSGSIGTPTFNMEVKIINNDGSIVSKGESGEMVVRCNSLSRGYLNNPEDQQSMFKEGWLYTKDIVKELENGTFKIIGRISQFINIAGNKVSPVEIEDFIRKHPEVNDCAVLGTRNISECAILDVSDSKEQVSAYVVRTRTSSLSEKELINFCQKGLANYKIPTRISFIDSLPKSPLGKVLKSKLG